MGVRIEIEIETEVYMHTVCKECGETVKVTMKYMKEFETNFWKIRDIILLIVASIT